jgi:hypothetical protein
MCTTLPGGTCVNNATNPPLCTLVNGTCPTGWTGTYPSCFNPNIPAGSCPNNATNYPVCTTDANGGCINNATNPPTCTNSIPVTADICTNPEAVNPPLCSINANGGCINNATNPPACTSFTCINNAINPPDCTIQPATTENVCQDIDKNPLTFTPEQQARLATLLRRFYLISSTLRTADDISTIYNEIDQNKNFVAQIEELTQQCYCQVDGKASAMILSAQGSTCQNLMANHTTTTIGANGVATSTKWVRHGNPWYNPLFPTKYTGNFPYSSAGDTGYLDYLPNGGLLETPVVNGSAGEKCQVVSGYYYGTATSAIAQIPTGGDCFQLNTFDGYGSCTLMSTKIFNDIRNPITAPVYEIDVFENNPDPILPTLIVPFNNKPNLDYLKAGCKWKDGVMLDNTERILNIW